MRHRSLIAAGALCAQLLAPIAHAQNFAENPFTDVPTSHANYQAIEHLRTNNVLKGYTDGTFKPEARINRAEFVKLITNPYILNTEELNGCVDKHIGENDMTVFFPDVRRDSWYAAEVCLAKVSKLINGYPDGTYKPGEYISFVEAAKIIASTFAFQTTTDPTDERWYKPYVEKLDEENAIPTTISEFAGKITRGEMAEILFRLKTNNTTKASRTYSNLR